MITFGALLSEVTLSPQIAVKILIFKVICISHIHKAAKCQVLVIIFNVHA